MYHNKYSLAGEEVEERKYCEREGGCAVNQVDQGSGNEGQIMECKTTRKCARNRLRTRTRFNSDFDTQEMVVCNQHIPTITIGGGDFDTATRKCEKFSAKLMFYGLYEYVDSNDNGFDSDDEIVNRYYLGKTDDGEGDCVWDDLEYLGDNPATDVVRPYRLRCRKRNQNFPDEVVIDVVTSTKPVIDESKVGCNMTQERRRAVIGPNGFKISINISGWKYTSQDENAGIAIGALVMTRERLQKRSHEHEWEDKDTELPDLPSTTSEVCDIDGEEEEHKAFFSFSKRVYTNKNYALAKQLKYREIEDDPEMELLDCAEGNDVCTKLRANLRYAEMNAHRMVFSAGDRPTDLYWDPSFGVNDVEDGTSTLSIVLVALFFSIFLLL